MAQTAVDEWARDMASEAKELASNTSTRVDSHEAQCLERHADMLGRHAMADDKLDAMRREMWMLSLSGMVIIVGALATIAWTLAKNQVGIQ